MRQAITAPAPLDFFGQLKWIDGRARCWIRSSLSP